MHVTVTDTATDAVLILLLYWCLYMVDPDGRLVLNALILVCCKTQNTTAVT